MEYDPNQPVASAQTRISTAFIIGLIVAAVVGMRGAWKFAPIAGWDTAAFVYLIWTWFNVWHMPPSGTKAHAKAEDPDRTTADIIIIGASLASLVAVVFLIIDAGNASGGAKSWEVFLGLISVVVSWCVVHTNYALRYARLYYGDPEGGIDFNEPHPPQYKDFAYMAFTVGMTFQIADTDVTSKEVRATVLRHAFLSYLFGTIIIATTINIIASLAK